MLVLKAVNYPRGCPLGMNDSTGIKHSASCGQRDFAKRWPRLELSIQETTVARTATTMSSRRKQIRYPLKASVFYRWIDQAGLQREAKGRTRDLSEAGAYVFSHHCPNEGDFVELTFRLIALRQQHIPGNEDFDMNGRVVRVDRSARAGAHAGFAVKSRENVAARESSDLLLGGWEASLANALVAN